MKSTVRKIGNSVGILIPKPFLAEVGLRAGDPVDIRVRKGRVYIEPIKQKRRADRAGAHGHSAPPGETVAAADGGRKAE